MAPNFPVISWLTVALSAGVTMVTIYWLNEKSAAHPVFAKTALTVLMMALLTLLFHLVAAIEIFH